MAHALESLMMPEEETVEEFAFTAPTGLTMPDNVQEGDAFEVVAKVRMQDGRIIFDQINGVALGGAEPDEEVEVQEDIESEEPVEDDLMTAAKKSGYA